MNQVSVTGRTDLGPEYVGDIFYGSLKKTLIRETNTIKSQAILQNFNFGMLKLTQIAKCQIACFVNLIIQELKF